MKFIFFISVPLDHNLVEENFKKIITLSLRVQIPTGRDYQVCLELLHISVLKIQTRQKYRFGVLHQWFN